MEPLKFGFRINFHQSWIVEGFVVKEEFILTFFCVWKFPSQKQRDSQQHYNIIRNNCEPYQLVPTSGSLVGPNGGQCSSTLTKIPTFLPTLNVSKFKSKEPPQTFVPKTLASWYGPIARGFWNLNQSIKQKVKNLQLENCRYIIRFGTLHSIFTQNG